MKILTSSDKKKILKKLNEQFGISNLPYLLIKFGEEKIRIFSGSLLKEELVEMDRILNIEGIGLYFAKEHNNEIRLTLDGLQLLKNQINKNILDLSNENAKKWFRGDNLYIQYHKGFLVLKNRGEFIGCGKSTGEKITNFMPKERRIKGVSSCNP